MEINSPIELRVISKALSFYLDQHTQPESRGYTEALVLHEKVKSEMAEIEREWRDKSTEPGYRSSSLFHVEHPFEFGEDQ